jgi:hypothetical protein
LRFKCSTIKQGSLKAYQRQFVKVDRNKYSYQFYF